MSSESIQERDFTKKTSEDNEKYNTRYLRRTPWNDNSDSEDSDVVSISSLDEVENDTLNSNTDDKGMHVMNKDLINDIDLHLSDPEEGELAEEEAEVSEFTKSSVEKIKDGCFLEKSEHFPFKSVGSKTTPMSFMTEGKYQKKSVSPLLRPKYDNYRELCAAELHCTLEENKERLNQRAKRFGLDVPPEVQVPKEELDSLYQSLGISSEQLNPGKIKHLRLDTVHIRGVEEMDSSDVVQYFDGYQPWSLEWVNDYSCNVLFKDDHYSAKALLNLSKVIEVGAEDATDDKGDVLFKDDDYSAEALLNLNKVIEVGAENATDDKDFEDKDMESDTMSNFGNSVCCSKDEENIVDDTVQMEVDKYPINLIVKKTSLFKIPVPPGKWRTGLPCPKAETLLMRFATKDDRKLPGAEKRSRFYQKYGNPNYGGLKGLISSSRKRKFQLGWHKHEVTKIHPENVTRSNEIVKTMNISGDDNFDSSIMGQKRVRMRMYADDIEGPWQKITSIDDKDSSHVTKRETQSKLLEGSSLSSSQASTAKIDAHSRFKIWTPIAEKMAKESQLAEEQSNYFGTSGQGSRSQQYHSTSERFFSTEKFSAEYDLREKLKKMRSGSTKIGGKSPLIINIDKTCDSNSSD